VPSTTVFFSYKAHILRGWNVFDLMSAAECARGAKGAEIDSEASSTKFAQP
jgi:hypothetical protein